MLFLNIFEYKKKIETMKYFTALIFSIVANLTFGQSFGSLPNSNDCFSCAPDNKNLAYKDIMVMDSQICIGVCYDREAQLGFQSFRWGIRSMVGVRIKVSFTKQYILKCDKIVEKKAEVVIEPLGFKTGENFSGELSLQDAFFKEDCEGSNKVYSFNISNLEVRRVN